MTLALAILGTFLGVANLVIGIYNLVQMKVDQAGRGVNVPESEYDSRESAREFARGSEGGTPSAPVGDGFVETGYDPAEDEEYPSSDELGV